MVRPMPFYTNPKRGGTVQYNTHADQGENQFIAVNLKVYHDIYHDTNPVRILEHLTTECIDNAYYLLQFFTVMSIFDLQAKVWLD